MLKTSSVVPSPNRQKAGNAPGGFCSPWAAPSGYRRVVKQWQPIVKTRSGSHSARDILFNVFHRRSQLAQITARDQPDPALGLQCALSNARGWPFEMGLAAGAL